MKKITILGLVLGIVFSSTAQNDFGLIKSLTLFADTSEIINRTIGVHYLSNTSFNLDTTEWHYIAVTKSASSYGKMYLDGELIIEGQFQNKPYIYNTLAIAATKACVSCSWVPKFKGYFDEFRVSNTARTDQEVSDYYNQNTEFETDVNTIGLWHFNETSGTTFSNEVGGNGDLISNPNFVSGKYSNCVYFDGETQYANCNLNIPETNFTLEFWFRSVDSDHSTLVMAEYAYNTGISISASNQTPQISWSNGDTANSITINPNIDSVIWVSNGVKTDTIDLYNYTGQFDTVAVMDTTVTEVFDTSLVTIYNNTDIPTDGLVAYYPFDGDANDESGNGNDGKTYSATLTTDRYGNENSAYYYDGVNDSLNITHDGNLTFHASSTFTLAGWFNMETDKGGYILSHKNGAFNGYVFNVMSNDHLTDSLRNRLRFEIEGNTNGVNPVLFSEVIDINTWYFFTISFDGVNDSMTIYLDGVKGESVALPTELVGLIGQNSLPLTLGKRNLETSDNYFHGLIDDIAMYNRVLSAEEIESLYSGNSCTDTIEVTLFDTVSVMDTTQVIVDVLDTMLIMDTTEVMDTSIVMVYDTNEVMIDVYDTTYVSVDDTLVITMSSDTAVGIDFLTTEVNVYPNPASTQLNVVIDRSGDYTVSLTNINEQIVLVKLTV